MPISSWLTLIDLPFVGYFPRCSATVDRGRGWVAMSLTGVYYDRIISRIFYPNHFRVHVVWLWIEIFLAVCGIQGLARSGTKRRVFDTPAPGFRVWALPTWNSSIKCMMKYKHALCEFSQAYWSEPFRRRKIHIAQIRSSQFSSLEVFNQSSVTEYHSISDTLWLKGFWFIWK